VAPNIIEGSIFNFRPKKKKDKIVFLMVAKFNYPKRPDLVIKALTKLFDKNEFSFELRIIGGGTELEKALKTNRTKSLPFSSLGFQPKEVIAEELQNSDFFLHPTDSETFGIVVNEALSTGTPVLASQIPVFQERIEAKDGILVQNDIGSWISGIQKLLDQQFNHREISERNSQLFSKERASKSFLDIYQRTTSNQGTSTNGKDN
jgi:glycosyltransferase involved in cell wall biosynthesis